jgi:hypothetical protein
VGRLKEAPSPFQAQGEISPGKNAHPSICTTAGYYGLRSGLHTSPFQASLRTQSFLDHKSFAVYGPLALIGFALYPVLVHRLAISIHASSPHSVALMQLRKNQGIKKGHPKAAFKKLERFFTYTAATGRM